MQIKIDLPPDIEQDLIRQATQSNISLQTLILQVLRRCKPHRFQLTNGRRRFCLIKESLISPLSSLIGMNCYPHLNRNYFNEIPARYLCHQRLHQRRTRYSKQNQVFKLRIGEKPRKIEDKL